MSCTRPPDQSHREHSCRCRLEHRSWLFDQFDLDDSLDPSDVHLLRSLSTGRLVTTARRLTQQEDRLSIVNGACATEIADEKFPPAAVCAPFIRLTPLDAPEYADQAAGQKTKLEAA